MQSETIKKLEVELVTESRKDLFNISAMLAKAFGDEVLADRENPVMIAVNGTFNGGKSIFPAAVRRVLLSSASHVAFKGEWQGDETWYAKRHEQKTEISFVNVNRSYYDRIEDFLKRRIFGGVTFMHNTKSDAQYKNLFGINIWIESHDYKRSDGRNMRAKYSPLAKDFERAAKNDWARYLKIEISDERLCALPAVQKFVDAINAGEHKQRDHYESAVAFEWYFKEKLIKSNKRLGLNVRNLKALGVGK